MESGFTYLKLDFNNIGGGGWYAKKRTSLEILRDHYANIRQAAGENTYILFCTGHPIRATVGLVDASRTSQDAHRGGVAPPSMKCFAPTSLTAAGSPWITTAITWRRS